jgi:hypothetical protein
VISFDHTQTHTTVSRTPLDEGSARRRDLYLTTQTLYKRQTIHAPGGIRTHDPSKRSVADLRFRPGGHWDRPLNTLSIFIFTFSGCLVSVININLLTSYIIASECTFAEMRCVGCEGHDDGGIVLVLYCYVLIWKYVTRPLTSANITVSYIGEESEHVSHY